MARVRKSTAGKRRLLPCGRSRRCSMKFRGCRCPGRKYCGGGGRRLRIRQRAINPFQDGVGKRLKTLSELQNYRSNNSDQPMVVWIYADWCGHCQMFLPVWKSLVSSTNNIAFVAINGDSEAFLKDSKTSSYPKVTGYPTLWLFAKGGQVPVAYRGQRSSESIKNALYRM